MKAKRILSVIIALAMVIGTMGFTALAAGDTTADKAVASIGGQYYSTVALAIADAAIGSEIDLCTDITGIPTITKAITIDGNNHHVTAKAAEQQFGVIDGEVIIKNIVFDNGNEAIRTDYGNYGDKTDDYEKLDLTLENCTFNALNNYAVMGGQASVKALKSLTVKGCIFNADTQKNSTSYMLYAQNVGTLVVKDCTFNGHGVTKGAIHTGDSLEQSTVATISGNKIDGVARGVQIGNRGSNPSISVSDNSFTNITTAADGKAGAIYIHDVSSPTTDVTVSANSFDSESIVLYNDQKSSEVLNEMLIFATDNKKNSVAITELTTAGTEVNIAASDASAATGVKSEDDLINAVAAAKAGDTITLLANVELTEILEIAADKVLTIDLGAFNITQTAENKNAITNYGDLTIKGTTGKIVGNWNGVFNTNKITVEGGTLQGTNNGLYNGDYDWDNYEVISEAVAIIEGGSFVGSEYNGIYNSPESTITVTGGSFSGENGYDICNDSDAQDVTIDGTFENAYLYNVAIKGAYTDCVLEYCSFAGDVILDNSIFIGDIVNGNNVTLQDNVTLSGSIKGGNITGMVTAIYGKLNITGGTFAAETKQSLEALNVSCDTGYRFSDNDNGTYTVEKAPKHTISIYSAGTNKGSITYIAFKAPGTTQGSTTQGSKTFEAYEDTTVTLTLKAKAADGYEFKGWYTNAEGSGNPVYADAEVENITFTVTGNYTLYAVFEESEKLAAFIANVNEWLGDYENSTAYTVDSKDEMEYFAYAVSAMGYNFSGKTVSLITDLDYTGETYTPVGTATKAFAGTFDGGENTISGVVLTGSYIGVFGKTTGMIRNLNIKDFTLSGSGYQDYVGGIVGQASGLVENCHAENVNVSGWFSGCIVGHTFGMQISNVSVNGGSVSGGKSGGIIGYANGLKLTDATVNGLTVNESTGVIGGHIHTSGNVLTDIVVENAKSVDEAKIALIGTTYEGGDISITGADTNIAVDMLTHEEAVTFSVSNGTYTVDVTKYCVDGYVVVNNGDGTFSVESAWTTATDAGSYLDADGETTWGMMRFLFAVDIDKDKVKSSGIKYLYSEDITNKVPNVEATGEPSNAFYGDIIEVPENTTGTYYAVAYIETTDGQWFWSDALGCEPNFEKFFADYTGGAE